MRQAKKINSIADIRQETTHLYYKNLAKKAVEEEKIQLPLWFSFLSPEAHAQLLPSIFIEGSSNRT
jgi:hypothetical protein